jgi:hypothetical protein
MFLKFAAPRGPGIARLFGGAFGFANRDHLPGVRASQLTTTGEAAALANAGEIGANGILGLRHSESSWLAGMMHHKRVTMQAWMG